MAVTNPPRQVIKNVTVGNIKTKGSSMNMRIWRVSKMAKEIPIKVPSNPDAVINEIAS